MNPILIIIAVAILAIVGYFIWLNSPAGKKWQKEQARIAAEKLKKEKDTYGVEFVEEAIKGNFKIGMHQYLVKEYLDGDYKVKNRSEDINGKTEEWHYFTTRENEVEGEAPKITTTRIVTFEGNHISNILYPD